MTLELLSRYWALLIASVLGTAIFLFVLFRLYEASARGQLVNRVRILRRCKSAALRAQRRLDRASERLARLNRRADLVKPRVLTEAGGAIEDVGIQVFDPDEVYGK